jgi:hypothetical protein
MQLFDERHKPYKSRPSLTQRGRVQAYLSSVARPKAGLASVGSRSAVATRTVRGLALRPSD